MLAASLFLLSLGLGAGIVLAIASRVFYVWEDPKVLSITDSLPGANCGGCGFAGCAACADAIVSGQGAVNSCVVGGFEVAQVIGEIMGQKVEAKEPDFSWTSCIYGVGEADPLFSYNGATDCQAAVMLYGGSKLCPIGCIGLGSCVKACQFGALSIGDNNLPIVDHELCVGCGACVEACPKNITTLTSTTRRIISEYQIDECTAPCQRSCPTGINIRGFIADIRKGNYEEALLKIKEKCPLPLVCGHICPAPCELNCRRNFVDEPVAINPLKRFVAEYEMTTGKHVNPYRNPANGKRIALVGGGAEGLTTAYNLSRLGYESTIFEAKPELGGILRYVIAKDRLPRNVLDHEIRGILDMGIQAKTNVEMGRDFNVVSLLRDGYDAVVLTSGGFDSRKILNPASHRFGAPVRGLYTMLDFFVSISEGASDIPEDNVVIVHSGLKGMDLAHKCIQDGASKVTILSDQPLSSLSAEFHESKELAAEGIFIRPSSTIAALGGSSQQLSRIMIEFKTVTGSVGRETMDIDTLIIPEPRIPELVFVNAFDKNESNNEDKGEWQTIEAFRTFPGSGFRGIFSSPEPGRISDSSAVVKSILSGRRLARAIHQHFTDGLITPIDKLVCESDNILDVTEVHEVGVSQRQRPYFIDVEGNSKTAWVFPKEFPGLDEQAARKEAERCLQCGLICYEKKEVN